MLDRRKAITKIAGAIGLGTSATSLDQISKSLSNDTTPVSGSSSNTDPSDHVRQRDRRIRLSDGRWLSFREYGKRSGRLVFYFHGTPGSRLELDICDAEVKGSGVRVIAVDRPGIGRSTYLRGRTILDWPGDVEQLAAALGVGESQFGIIGLSGGAPYASVCAARIPHRLTHVALVSGHTPPCVNVSPGSQDRMIAIVAKRPRIGKFALERSDKRLERNPNKMIKKIAASWTSEDRKLVLCNPQRYRELKQNLNETMRCGSSGLLRDISLLGTNWGFKICEIRNVPVSIWQGGSDQIVTPSMARYFHKSITGSELTIDPKAGHITMFKWHADEILRRFV